MPNYYWENIEVGDPVVPLTKPPVTRVQISRYAGASEDYSPLHIDDDFAKAAGYGGVFAHGAIALGFAIEAVAKWLENGRIVKTDCTFQKLVWPGDILTAKGVVVDKFESGPDPLVEVDVWTENQNGDVVMRGKVSCVLFRTQTDERKAKGSWPQLSGAPVRPEVVDEDEDEFVPKKKTGKKAAKKAAPAKKAKKAPAKAKKAPAKKKAAKKAPAKKAKKAAPKKKAAKKAPAKKKKAAPKKKAKKKSKKKR